MEKIRHHSRNYCSKWRRSKLGKTKPNHLYFARLIKKETEDFLRENKNYLLTYKPETYYAMKNQKLPKKYQKKQRINIAPVNAFVPPQSKLSAEELKKQMEKESELQKEKEAKAYEKKQALQKEKERIKRNQEAYEREKRYISFCNPYEPINKNRLGHSKIIKKKKNYNYY